jgi:hypothetical protein
MVSDSEQVSQVSVPEAIISRSMNRLEGNVDAIGGQIKALEEKLSQVMRDAATDDGEKGLEGAGHMGVPIAVRLHNMSESLEGHYNRLDDLLQRIAL